MTNQSSFMSFNMQKARIKGAVNDLLSAVEGQVIEEITSAQWVDNSPTQARDEITDLLQEIERIFAEAMC